MHKTIEDSIEENEFGQFVFSSEINTPTDATDDDATDEVEELYKKLKIKPLDTNCYTTVDMTSKNDDSEYILDSKNNKSAYTTIHDFSNDPDLNKLLSITQLPGVRNGSKKIRNYHAMELVRIIIKSIKHDLADSTEIYLLDKIQRRFANDNESMKTFFNIFINGEDLGILHASEDDEFLNNDIESPFNKKHKKAYKFIMDFNIGDSFTRGVYESGKEAAFLNKKIVLIFDGQQRLTMLTIFFGGGSFGKNKADKSGDKKRYPYLDLKHVVTEIDSHGILRYRLSTPSIITKNSGVVFLSNDELSDKKYENMHLVRISDFGDLDNPIFFNNGVFNPSTLLKIWKNKYNLDISPDIQQRYALFIIFMHAKLFKDESVSIIFDPNATSESNAKAFESQAYSARLGKETMIEGGLNSTSNTDFGIQISDKISLALIKFGISSEKIAFDKAIRTLVSGLHQNQTIKCKGRELDKSIWVNPNNFYGDGTTNSLESFILNNGTERRKYTKHFMRKKEILMQSLNMFDEMIYKNQGTEKRDEYKFTDSLDDTTKSEIFHFIFITYVNTLISGFSGYTPFKTAKKNEVSDSKKTANLIGALFVLNPLVKYLTNTEISAKVRALSMLSRTMVASKLNFTAENLILIQDYIKIFREFYPVYLKDVNPREFIAVSDNKEDTTYLKLLFNQYNLNVEADHIHAETLLATDELISDKVDALFSDQGIPEYILEYYKNVISDTYDTSIAKCNVSETLNGSKQNTPPAEFFTSKPVFRDELREYYKLFKTTYLDNDIISLLSFVNYMSLLTHNNLVRLKTKLEFNKSISTTYPDRDFTVEYAFDNLLENINLEIKYPLLFKYMMLDDMDNLLSKTYICSLVKL